MKRLPFLDWMRGLAVVVMIQCHAFNSFAKLDLRSGTPYVLSQFIGGMAAPLFLFMAGMTLAFQMDRLDRREPSALGRWRTALKRGGYVLGIAFLFRFTNWMGSFPNGSWREITKVDILNCMGVAMAAFSVAAVVAPERRVGVAALMAAGIAAASPLVANLPWGAEPTLLHDYLAPSTRAGRFPFFPCAAYAGFGLAVGTAVRRAAGQSLDRLIQIMAAAAFAMIFAAQYLADAPYSVYAKSNFWIDSPWLIFIRVGVAMLMLAGAYLWTQRGAGARWSWMQSLGKTSLMVYWVHVVLVYGVLAQPIKRTMSIAQTVLATALLIVLMVALSAAKLRWKDRKTREWRAATTVAGRPAEATAS